MTSIIQNDTIPVEAILRQETGRFDQRFGVGPARWDCWDLLWLHEGELQLIFVKDGTRLNLRAPSGILIPPDTEFSGSTAKGVASASVIHFDSPATSGEVLLVPENDRLHVQHLIQLSLDFARRGETLDRRRRLLDVILECFAQPRLESRQSKTRLDRAWREAEDRLGQVRSLADVAAFYGQAESTLRAAHRKQYGASAGRHLQQMRLSAAERYLATTGFGLEEIANLVGYGHAETLSAVFKRSRGRTPGKFRRWCKQFA